MTADHCEKSKSNFDLGTLCRCTLRIRLADTVTSLLLALEENVLRSQAASAENVVSSGFYVNSHFESS